MWTSFIYSHQRGRSLDFADGLNQHLEIFQSVYEYVSFAACVGVSIAIAVAWTLTQAWTDVAPY